MNHSFNIEIAEKLGIEKAVLVEHIAFWQKKNIANEKHNHDGHYWTYSSAAAFAEIFPYMKKKSIERWLRDMENEGILKSANYNKLKMDKTKWYTLVSDWICPLYSMPQNEAPCLKMRDGELENEAPIPDINTDNKPPIVPQEDIDEIYKIYPGKCKINDRSTGKCAKDKERILKLFKSGLNKEIIIKVLNAYLHDCKKSGTPLKNFATLLNNFPDPESMMDVAPEDRPVTIYKKTMTLDEWKDYIPLRDARNDLDFDMKVERLRGIEDNDKFYDKIIDLCIFVKACEILHGITRVVPYDLLTLAGEIKKKKLSEQDPVDI